VGCGALEVDLSPRPITRAQFFSVGLQWLAFALVWGALTLAPLLQCDPRALPLSLRISLAAAASLLAFGYMRALGPRPATAPVFRPPTGDPNLAPPQDMR
jgi:hypothetical protein